MDQKDSMRLAKYETTMRRLLPPVAVFVLASVFYLATFTPSIWYADALNFISGSVPWARGEYALPLRAPLMYPGWIAAIALLPAARSMPLDPLQLILGAKLLGMFSAAAATLGLYLVSERLFRSKAFAAIAAALFAANPLIWLWGQAAMSDVPAMALMMFSLLFFVRFHQGRNSLDLAVSSVFLGLAAFIRIQAMVMLVPYLIGIVAAVLSGPEKSFAARMKLFVGYGLCICVFPAALLYMVHGKPWEYRGTPMGVPRARDLFVVLKWYAARVIGWPWLILAAIGIVIGLARRASRAVALMLAAFIAVGCTYFASMNVPYPADMPRYLLPTLPFTLLAMGFLWTSLKTPAVKATISVVAAAYVGSILFGLHLPASGMPKEPSRAAKLLVLQSFIASDFAKRYHDAFPGMMADIALSRALPDGSAIIMSGGTFLERHVRMQEATRSVRVISLIPHLPEPERFRDLAAVADHERVFVVPGPDDADVRARLADMGFIRRGEVGGAALFTKVAAAR